ncbi:MAG: ABC transporter permease [Culicoidibacterales bacterium]
MNYMKRAMTSVLRRKGKSTILFILIFVLGNVIAGAISVQQATSNVEKTIKDAVAPVATIEPDYEKLQDVEEPLELVTVEKVREIGQSQYVKSYDFSTRGMLSISPLKIHQTEALGQWGAKDFGAGGVSIKGVELAKVLDIEEKKIELTKGRVFTDAEISEGKNVMLISMQLAELNNLNVGDTVPLKNIVYDYGGIKGQDATSGEPEVKVIASEDVNLEIIGIFDPKIIIAPAGTEGEDNVKGGDMSKGWREAEAINKVYVPNKVVTKASEFQREKSMEQNPGMDPEDAKREEYYQPVYIIKNPEDMEKFKKAVLPILPKNYKIVTSSDGFDNIAGPILTMKSLATYTLYIAVGASLLILSLLIVLFLRDRKHELGIYLSLGEVKIKVMIQIVTEVIAVAFIAISLSLVSGNMIATAVSDGMVMNQMASSKKDGRFSEGYSYSSLNEAGYASEFSKDQILDAYSVKLDASYIGMFYLVGLSTIIISTAVPMIYILRLNPKKIML